MKLLILTAALFVATAYGATTAMAHWSEAALQPWILGIGVATLALGSIAIKISGLDRIRRILRDVLIGAWLGHVLRKIGLYGPRMAKALRVMGYETAPEGPSRAQLEQNGLSWSRLNDAALVAGWCTSIFGMALIWTAI